MSIARKLGVSTTGSLSQSAVKSARKRPNRNQRKLSTHQEVALRAKQLRANPTPESAFSPPESSKQRRHPSQNPLPPVQRTAINPFSPQKTSFPRAEVNKPKVRNIPVMPSAQAVPFWLLRLYAVHRYSSIAAFLFVIVMLAVYGLTVYSQELWSQSYRKLQNLQRQERQLMTTNGVLKSNMAKQAQKQPEKLLSPTPDRMIFLTPAPVTSTSPSTDSKTPISEIQQETLNPTGY
ncbi:MULTISPECIES: hypothetical protein [Nostocales]|uniref:Cell division protein FtsL n=3 Tax=Nostocales TaxID=1161 RepID=A0A0C1QUE0_9CYAN|nr:hypothetical protein [Tolypothrix bouteillei]KAF3885210.1 hypothetical protein DA73_0400006870 [Tolypothrix bouteillei VB521301]